MSRIVAAGVLVVTSPILVAVALAVKIASPGPALYRAVRLGQGGREFVMLKFRTMHRAARQKEQPITGRRDARVFPFGRWLRRMKIDELPELANVVRGEMVLVGPRPEDPTIVAAHYTPLMLRTLEVKPGLVSPGTLDYLTRETSLPVDPREVESAYVSDLLPRKIALDLAYIENRSWGYDVELMVRAVVSILGVSRLYEGRRAWEERWAEGVLKSVTADRSPEPMGADL